MEPGYVAVSFGVVMPTYVYKFIDTDETIEIQQSFTDDTLTEAVHPDSGATMPVKKVFLPVGVTFKGDGFYKTDNRDKKKSRSNTAAGTSSDSNSSSGSSSDTKSESKSDLSSSSADAGGSSVKTDTAGSSTKSAD